MNINYFIDDLLDKFGINWTKTPYMSMHGKQQLYDNFGAKMYYEDVVRVIVKPGEPDQMTKYVSLTNKTYNAVRPYLLVKGQTKNYNMIVVSKLNSHEIEDLHKNNITVYNF